jgi:hypothetical protein
MMSSQKIIRKILADHGVNDNHARYAYLVKAIDALCDDVDTVAYDEGHRDGHEEGLEEGRDDALDSTVSDLATFLSLANSDPQSAAVYFHRATGKHIFEVQQPCLL